MGNQREKRRLVLLILVSVAVVFCNVRAIGQTRPWVTAYYAGWELGNGDNGRLHVSDVDFSALTHVIHFALVPKPDGSLDSAGNSITSAGSLSLTRSAHKAGTKVLISVGGWNSGQGFEGATLPQNLSRFVVALDLFMTSRGYDGIDLDWEPLNPQDQAPYANLIQTLRRAIGTSRLLTAAAGEGDGAFMASVQQDLDQINIMTYDLSFPSPGWVTWYNGALHDHGLRFASTGNALPACDNIVSTFVRAGVSKQKLGIGIELGGSVWKGGLTPEGNGVTRPNQSWVVAPVIIPDVPYSTIMKDYFARERYHWDPGAMASYLSIDSVGSNADCFVSYDDTADVAAKIEYVRQEGLGGIFLYELGMGFTDDRKIPLLEAIERSVPDSHRKGPTVQANSRARSR